MTAETLVRQLQEGVKALQGLRIVRGVVSAAGGVTAGVGFTPARSGAGLYTVTFSPVFSDVPAFVAMPGQSLGQFGAKIQGTVPVTNVVAAVVTFNTGTGVPADSEFHFIAIGAL